MMEIRCSECGHLGVARDVRGVEGGVGLVCAECGHLNVVSAGDGEEGEDVDERGADGELDSDEAMLSESVRRLLPQPGEGRRCRKCAHLFAREDLEHCARCGLSVAEAENFPDGQAPWDTPPEGREEEFEEAMRIWESVAKGEDSQAIVDYVDYVVEQGLTDMGIRRLQHYLVENPQDPVAIDGLARLAKAMEMAVEVARSRAESRAEEFQDGVKRFRSAVMVVALIFWIAIFLLFSWVFLG